MRLLQDDFHGIKYNGLNSASNCSEVKPKESICIAVDLPCIGKRETVGRIRPTANYNSLAEQLFFSTM